MPRLEPTQVERGKVQPIEQAATRRKRLIWPALLVIAVLVAVAFAPKYVLWFGIILLLLCVGAFAKDGADLVGLSDRMDTTTTVGKIASALLTLLAVAQDSSRRLLRLDVAVKWQSGLRLAVYGIIGLALIVAGRTGAEYKAEREKIAAEQAAKEAEQRRLANAANANVAALVAEAESGWRNGNLAFAEEKLECASKTANATEFDSIHQLRIRMANANVEALIVDATSALHAGDIPTAREKVKAALAVPHANTLADARTLDQQIANATDANRIRAALMDLSDEAFQQLKDSGTVPAQILSGYEGLDRRTVELAKADVEHVTEARENRRLAQLEAQRKRQEEARLAQEGARQRAEADRQRKAQAEAEAARKAEEKYIPGLVAVDVYGNFTNKGFKLTKDFNPAFTDSGIEFPEQHIWISADENARHKMRVEVFGEFPTRITLVRATYSNFSQDDTDQSCSQFLAYVASTPYDGSEPSKAQAWVKKNIGNNTKTTIGGVSFELIASASRVRMLLIQPEPN